jgi:molybdopterin/thiamine biosynthesis adenylyltransferase
VSYEPAPAEGKVMNINDDKVKDRWSRYIGAMGIEAVVKQAESRILICGLGALGVEIAKNTVLAGCKELILFDDA